MLNGSRRKRIALGSGTKVQDVNRLLKQYRQMRKMMKTVKKSGFLQARPDGRSRRGWWDGEAGGTGGLGGR